MWLHSSYNVWETNQTLIGLKYVQAKSLPIPVLLLYTFDPGLLLQLEPTWLIPSEMIPGEERMSKGSTCC